MAVKRQLSHNANDQGYTTSFGTEGFAHAMDGKRRQNANDQGCNAPFGIADLPIIAMDVKRRHR